MSHPDEGVLQELLDGELAPADAVAVRAHLATCAPCHTTYEELKAMQLEADAIIERLPLDPPLARSEGRAPRRPPNLRLLGLAASALLVAGTSWILFRSSPSRFATDRTDTLLKLEGLPPARQPQLDGPAVDAPPAARPSQEAAGTTPRANGNGFVLPGQAANRQAQRAPAAPAEAQGQPAEAREAEKKEADDRPLADASGANAAAPMSRLAPSAIAPARLAAGAAKETSRTVTTLADAETRLGGRLLTIADLTPQSVEFVAAHADSLAQVLQTYIVNGVPVILEQRGAAKNPTTLVARDEVTSMKAVPQKAKRIQAADSEGPATPAVQRRTWQSDGVFLSIEGALSADSLDALARRVR